MPSDPAVSLRNVSIVRDGTLILDDINWDIDAGEHWVLFGANGSGKTTLMEIVSSYLYPTRGTVCILGERLGQADARSLRSRIGYVGPAPTQFVRARLPALEIVVTGRHASFVDTRWHDYDDADWAYARQCIENVQASDLSERAFGSLSEGEKKRVLIARSLMSRPELLLLDEPGSGLDIGARERLVSSLEQLTSNDDGPPIVLVTHHVEEIPPGFDRTLMLAGGKVMAAGYTEDVLTADTLARTFGLTIDVERSHGRWRAWSHAGRTPPVD